MYVFYNIYFMDQQQNDRACNRPLGTAKRVSVVIYLFFIFFIRYCLICLTLRSNVPEGMSPFWRFWFVVVEKKKKMAPLCFDCIKREEIWTREIGFCLYAQWKKKKGGQWEILQMRPVCVHSVPFATAIPRGGVDPNAFWFTSCFFF